MILRKQFLAHVAQTSPSPMLVEVARAEGSFFYTPEGKRYFDLVAGVSVSNVGHGNPAVVRAVQEQAARYMHVMVYGELVETPQVEYAARIASLLPAPLESVYFVNSGAEAVEGLMASLPELRHQAYRVSIFGDHRVAATSKQLIKNIEEYFDIIAEEIAADGIFRAKSFNEARSNLESSVSNLVNAIGIELRR